MSLSDVSPQQWRGLQVAAAELMFLAFPQLHSIYLSTDDAPGAWCFFSAAPSKEDESDCKQLLAEILAVADLWSSTDLTCVVSANPPDHFRYKQLLSREALSTLPSGVAPWREAL
jgi:hypothetical protein